MKRRPLGAGGPDVSAVGLGAMSIAGFYGPCDADGADALFSKCLDLGVDHIDTANVYGPRISEERIGAFLAKQGARRNDLFKIATKAGLSRDAQGNRSFDNGRGYLEAELDKSLQRLGVDRVELFYVHRRDPETPIEEVTESLASLVRTGKIGRFGFSEIAPTSLGLAAAVHPVAVVQSEYSLSTRSPELGLVQQTAKLGAALVAFSPVGRGLLTDRPHSREAAQGIDFLKNNARFMEPNHSRNLAATERFRALAREMGVAAASLAIAWTLHKGEHVLAIPGTRSPAHLEELAAGGALDLSESDLAAIESTLPIGWCHGDRYNAQQWVGPERYS